MPNSRKTKIRFLLPLCSFVSFVVLLPGCAGEPKHPTWSNSTGAEQNEKLMWKAIQEKDWKTIEWRLSATFVGVNPDGQVLDRAGWLAFWKGSPVTEFSLGEVSVLPEGPDMKVSYILHTAGVSGKAPSSGGLQVVSVWQETGATGDSKKPFKSHWILITSSMTPIQEAESGAPK